MFPSDYIYGFRGGGKYFISSPSAVYARARCEVPFLQEGVPSSRSNYHRAHPFHWLQVLFITHLAVVCSWASSRTSVPFAFPFFPVPFSSNGLVQNLPGPGSFSMKILRSFRSRHDFCIHTALLLQTSPGCSFLFSYEQLNQFVQMTPISPHPVRMGMFIGITYVYS